jgi:hypothetical protein
LILILLRSGSASKARSALVGVRCRLWAISVLQEAGAIRECEEHGWMQDRADPNLSRVITDPVSFRSRVSLWS